MPHLVILYTPNLETEVDMGALCRDAADAMLAVRDDEGRQVFPTGGTRVLAYPAAHYAVADGGAAGRAAGGSGDYGFMYLNLRMAAGRSAATQQRAGQALLAAVRKRMDPLLAQRPIGITLQVDEGHEVFDAKHSSLHPLFAKP
ncbi:5-carboxymethyl-2-hydroxymuconate Delta-isomerase [Ramlibacter sp. 2FC]|uniref:5-carboxymethyl-2-hydroxymuconate Delta-isomerase n=1 Tax=Ramlibacter sp. 2FC TaxID=2502188 RepID=UPI0010F66792|nr:5-carboxymethyl-2-hydroxymuconate Delta-isomerase [Ramlibacter sp. 2FC]